MPDFPIVCCFVAQCESTYSSPLLSISAFFHILFIFYFLIFSQEHILSSHPFHRDQYFPHFFSFVGYQVINRSPKYKNKYVHRRSSVSLDNLTPEEVYSSVSPLCLFFLHLIRHRFLFSLCFLLFALSIPLILSFHHLLS